MKLTTRHRLASFHCSIARAAQTIAPDWIPLILRDVFFGLRRFDEIEQDLGISTNVLTNRLDELMAAGILERAAYRGHPSRYEYRPTEKGAALFPVLLGLLQWGDRWAPVPEGPPVQLRHLLCGNPTTPAVVCGDCGKDLTLDNVVAHSGPGARARRGTSLLASHLPPDPSAPASEPKMAGRKRSNRRPARLRERFAPAPVAPAPANVDDGGTRAYRKPMLAARARERARHERQKAAPDAGLPPT